MDHRRGIGILVLCSSAVGQSDTPAIDHVRVLVHDIAAAQNTLHALGFEMRRPEPSVYQEGSAHNSAPFSAERVAVLACSLVRCPTPRLPSHSMPRRADRVTAQEIVGDQLRGVAIDAERVRGTEGLVGEPRLLRKSGTEKKPVASLPANPLQTSGVND
jgi:hypothetical protein